MGNRKYEGETIGGKKYWEDEDGNREYEGETIGGRKYREDSDGNRTYEGETIGGRKYRAGPEGEREYEGETIGGRKYWEDEDGNRSYEGETIGGRKYEEKEEGGGCFLTTACVKVAGLPDNCVELQVMRSFRDKYIASLPYDAELVEDYYRTAPTIAQRMKADANSAVRFEALLATIRSAVTLIEAGREADALELCKEEFAALKRRYTVVGI